MGAFPPSTPRPPARRASPTASRRSSSSASTAPTFAGVRHMCCAAGACNTLRCHPFFVITSFTTYTLSVGSALPQATTIVASDPMSVNPSIASIPRRSFAAAPSTAAALRRYPSRPTCTSAAQVCAMSPPERDPACVGEMYRPPDQLVTAVYCR